MPELTCNACNKEFEDDAEQKLHHKSDWHRYNLKRKVAGVPGVTEAQFLTRQSILHNCALWGKGYRSSKAHAQHLKSRSHIVRACHGTNPEEKPIVKPLLHRVADKQPFQRLAEDGESGESEREEVDEEEELVGEVTKSLTDLNVKEMALDDDMNEDEPEELLDPSSCFMCDQEHDNIEGCMDHLHKQHGFFIPDVEYLKDPKGFLTYLGLKVKRDLRCLYCNDQCHPFNSLEAVRKHMAAKSHCKVHYGDGDDNEEAELEGFYDYSSSYVDGDGKQLMASGDMANAVELGTGGSELIITTRSDNKVSSKILGSREYLRYYRQQPRPSPAHTTAISAASLASRYRSMVLAMLQSREHMVGMKVLKEMNRSGVESTRTKIGMKNNVIRNLPKNVPY